METASCLSLSRPWLSLQLSIPSSTAAVPKDLLRRSQLSASEISPNRKVETPGCYIKNCPFLIFLLRILFLSWSFLSWIFVPGRHSFAHLLGLPVRTFFLLSNPRQLGSRRNPAVVPRVPDANNQLVDHGLSPSHYDIIVLVLLRSDSKNPLIPCSLRWFSVPDNCLQQMSASAHFKLWMKLKAESLKRSTSKPTHLEYPKEYPLEEEHTPHYNPRQIYPVEIGQVLGKRYEIILKLGYGTSSTVWLARDKKKYVHLSISVV